MYVHYKGFSAVLSADLRSRAMGGIGYLDGQSAVILDLVLEDRRGPQLGLTGIAADLFRERSQKVILDAVDDDALTSLNVVLSHFTGHARYWALRRGGHHHNADPLKLAGYYGQHGMGGGLKDQPCTRFQQATPWMPQGNATSATPRSLSSRSTPGAGLARRAGISRPRSATGFVRRRTPVSSDFAQDVRPSIRSPTSTATLRLVVGGLQATLWSQSDA